MKKIIALTTVFSLTLCNLCNIVEASDLLPAPSSTSDASVSTIRDRLTEWINLNNLYAKIDHYKQTIRLHGRLEDDDQNTEYTELTQQWNECGGYAHLEELNSYIMQSIINQGNIFTNPEIRVLLQPFFFNELLPDPRRCKNSVEQNKNELFPAKCASRSCKSSAERNAVISLIALIQKQTGIKIDDVRFIDALSLTNSLFEENIKSEALQELENGDVDSNTKFILDHISKYEFSSEPFKESLLRLVANGCKESKIFRDCLIADIAKINSTIPKPIKRFTMGYPHFEFIESDFHSYNLYGIIKLTCDRDHVYMQTFFDSSSTVKHMGGGIYAAEYGDFQPMHHEIGHFSSASYIKYLAIFDMDETMQLIAKLIVGEKFDQNAFDQTFYRFNSLFIEAPDGIRKQLIEGYLHRHRHTFHDCNSLDEAKEQITKAGSSKEGIAKLAFLNYGEILQILGLSLINYNGHHTLVINLLSDFALSVELGLPIRSDHTSYGLNPIKETYKYILPDTSYAIHSINFEFYGAMLEIYGSSMQQYTLRLMYGNSMFPILNAEQKLGQEYLLKKALKNNLISIEINDDVNI